MTVNSHVTSWHSGANREKFHMKCFNDFHALLPARNVTVKMKILKFLGIQPSHTLLCGLTVWFRHSFHFCTFKCKWSSRRFFIREMTADYLYRWLFRNFLWFLLANSFTVHNLWTIRNKDLAYWEITVNEANGKT